MKINGNAYNPVLDVKPGYYCDPYDNIAIRSPAGMWSVYSVDEDQNENFVFHPNPRQLDCMVKMFIFIEDL